jgi:tetratricopeptide (TPR) repeat protein
VKDMMATLNSVCMQLGAIGRLSSLCSGVFLAATVSMGVTVLRAHEVDDAVNARYREEAARQYHEARDRHRADPENPELAWQFGRATFDLAEVSHNKQERETLAEEGIEACRLAIAREPDLVAAHYYLGMNLGQLARVHLLRGLRIVSEMEQAFKRAGELDPRFDYSGADRSLGLLYHRAPGWPISVGNKTVGRRHLERAVQLSPNYPENRLALAEALWDTNRREAFLREVRALEELLPKAREAFDSEVWIWAWAWSDWDQRWAALQARAKAMAEAD